VVYLAPFTESSSVTIKYYSVDKATNAEQVKSQQITVAPAPPVTSILCNLSPCDSSTTYLAAVTVSFVVSDTGGSGVVTTYYTEDGSDPTTSSSTQTYLAPFTETSSATIKFYSVDSNNVAETPQAQTITIGAGTGSSPVGPNGKTSSTSSSGDTTSTTTASPTGSLFSDNFESGGFSNWTSFSNATVQTGVVDAGKYSAQMTASNSGADAVENLGAPYNELWAKERFNIQSQTTSAYLMRFKSSGALVGAYVGPNGVLCYRNEITATSGCTSATPTTHAWHTLLIHVTVSGASSGVELWLDGTKLTSTTDSLGTNPISRFELGDSSGGKTFDVAFDNVVVSASELAP
jgi:Chitobiase/beta-hexosaminidase C-terminal domain